MTNGRLGAGFGAEAGGAAVARISMREIEAERTPRLTLGE